MMSGSISSFMVDTLCGESPIGRTPDRNAGGAESGTALAARPVPRIGLAGRFGIWIGRIWGRSPETLDMAMERLAEVSPHLLDDIGVSMTPPDQRGSVSAGNESRVVVRPIEPAGPRVRTSVPSPSRVSAMAAE
jgi:hypothetical protein